MYPESIEAHYRQSPFIAEVCVFGLPADGGPPERLHAVVVPDRAQLQARRIVNAGEIIRFEMDGRSATLPPDARVPAWRISMTPLPRAASGALLREQVAREAEAALEAPRTAVHSNADREWMRSEAVAHVLGAIRSAVPDAPLAPDANLELDLGLDSLARVELLGDLELTFGVRLPVDCTASIFTVRDLVEAVQRNGGRAGHAPADAAGWARLLADPGDDARKALIAAENDHAIRLIYGAVRAVLGLGRLGVRWTIQGARHLPGRGSYLLCPNHQSYLDPFVLAGLLPFRVVRRMFFVGATEYLQHPLAAWAARQVRLVSVDPDAELLPAMRLAAFGLRRNRVLMLFPEGERSIDGTVRRFKDGAAILSAHLQVPVVPVALDGLHELWPRTRALAWRRLRPWRRHRVAIRIGPPIAPPAPPVLGRQADERAAAIAAHTAAIRARVSRLWEEVRQAE